VWKKCFQVVTPVKTGVQEVLKVEILDSALFGVSPARSGIERSRRNDGKNM
jgi:hypothetical protein